jgi:UDP-glucose 4-epimerase
MRQVLVTGGAGYIGSHAVHGLMDQGDMPIIFDNLSTGFPQYLPTEAKLVVGDLGSDADLDQLFQNHHFDAVMHFAGSIIVPESVTNPGLYYQNNTANTLRLLKKMVETKTDKLVFSSTAAVYGNPDSTSPITETASLQPINPYGVSKWMSEMIIADMAKAHNFKATCLRYFNVAGADDKGRSGQSSPVATHLIKRATRAALGKDASLSVFGQDYPTRDGSGVRDYIHVNDLIDAHLLALDHLEHQDEVEIFNCGYGKGYSVLEVIAATERVSDKALQVIMADRRDGDSAELVASSDRIRKILGWRPKRDHLDQIITTALAWENTLP